MQKKYYALAALAAVTAAFFYFVNDDKPSANGMQDLTDSNQLAAENSPSTKPKPTHEKVSAPANQSAPIDTSHFAQCQQVLYDMRVEQEQWRQEKVGSFTKFLQQGYSLDEVTLAIDEFRNSNFAARFRVAQLRKNAAITEVNAMLEDELKQRLADKPITGLSIQRRVPLQVLDNFDELSLAQQQEIADSGKVTVDDVAFMMGRSKYSDEQILMLTKSLPDPGATVGYEHLDEAVSLLDFAAKSGRLSSFNYLIDQGLAPTQDRYLGSTMEWALSGLMDCCERRQRRVDIIKKLNSLGAAARFREQSPTRVYGNFPRRFYRFDQADIASLRDEFGLNLLAIKQRQPLSMTQHGRLVKRLAKQRDDFIETQTAMTDVTDTRAACRATVKRISDQWRPRRSHEVVQEIREQYPDSDSSALAVLADMDPALVDEYRRYFVWSGGMRQTDALSEVYQYLADGDIERVIRELEAASLNASEKRFVISNLLKRDLNYYRALSQSSLMDGGLQHHQLAFITLDADKIKTLADLGYDLYGYDNRGKSLLYYAVTEANTETVAWLIEQNAPYEGDGRGRDPLYQAIKHASGGQSAEQSKFLIDQLMTSYQPTVTRFHKQRMAVVKLRYPEQYQQLIDLHPALTVDEATELPVVW